MSSSDNDSITITLATTESGLSESLPLSTTTTTNELKEFACALFGFDNANQISLFKDGRAIKDGGTLGSLNIVNGDMIAVQKKQQQQQRGLDFSTLLGNTSNTASLQSNENAIPEPVYYTGMTLDDAMRYNSHPNNIVKLLQTKQHLFKELNYHNPRLANRIRDQSYTDAVSIWRQEIVKGGIQQALQVTTKFHQERDMRTRLQNNPNDVEAKEYFAKQSRQGKVQQQYIDMMNEYPEALGRVLMLYIEAKINDHPIQAFCDSGAQSTIMSRRVAAECELLDYIDTRFAGTAVGVGTGKIIGRIHMVQLRLGNTYFPCSVTVMDDPPPGANEMPFLLGLDMMKRHTCQIDLEKGVIRFRLSPGQYMEAPFLHEKDLSVEQGGTKGFDVNKSNEEAMRRMEKDDDDGNKDDDDDDGDKKM